MEEIRKYVEENKQRFLDELFELIRIPSISSESKHKPDMYRCAEQWTKIMLAAGADRAEVYETEGNPVAYGEKIIDPALPTVLVYVFFPNSSPRWAAILSATYLLFSPAKTLISG